ncbi:MAG: ADOP family duplicated permease, partial [Bryobacteraceae bacterium]
WLESLLRDFRYGLRQLRKTPTVTAIIIASLALGIGANSAIFNLVDAALFKPLPVKKPQALRLIEWASQGFPKELCSGLNGSFDRAPDGEARGSSIAPRVYRELSGEQRAFAKLIGFSDPGMALVAVGKSPARQVRLQYISANFFSGLGISLPLGRSFLMQEAQIGQPVLAVISNRFWHSRFEGRRDVLGKVVRVNDVPVQIVGVAPAGFFGAKVGTWVDLYAPLAARAVLNTGIRLARSHRDPDRFWWVQLMARGKPGVAEAQATVQLSTQFRHLVVPPGLQIDPKKVPKLISSPGARGFDPIGTDESRVLWIVLLMVGLILLIVCANVANLLLSRAAARQRESAVCLALGAARLRLLRQYLVESLTLAVAGGLAGLFLSYWLSQAIQYFVRADLNVGDFNLLIDGRMLGFTLAVSLASALLFGLAPAWQLTRASVHEALKANSRSVMFGKVKLPRVLVAVQIGLSFTLLVAAGLLGRSLTNLETEKIGFNRQNLVYASVNPWSAGYKPEQADQYVARLRERLASIPGVSRVAVMEVRPFSGDTMMTTPNIPGRPYRQDGSENVFVNQVSDGLFKTLGVPLREGRRFQPGDMRPKSDAVIVDESFVRHFYPHRDPIGQRFGNGPKPKELCCRIVGVVGNSRYYNLRDAHRPIIFQPYSAAREPGSEVNFAIRSGLDTRQLARAIRKAASAIDPTVPVVSIQTQTELIDRLL